MSILKLSSSLCSSSFLSCHPICDRKLLSVDELSGFASAAFLFTFLVRLDVPRSHKLGILSLRLLRRSCGQRRSLLLPSR